jgi:hypothetical protein
MASSVKKSDTPKKVGYELFQSMGDFLWKALNYPFDTSAEEIRRAFDQGEYARIHTFKLPAEETEEQLERVFYLSNHWTGRNICHRSTSVGDLVKVGKTFWIVAPVGFDRLWDEQ